MPNGGEPRSMAMTIFLRWRMSLSVSALTDWARQTRPRTAAAAYLMLDLKVFMQSPGVRIVVVSLLVLLVKHYWKTNSIRKCDHRKSRAQGSLRGGRNASPAWKSFSREKSCVVSA